jgi:hypothetical protein
MIENANYLTPDPSWDYFGTWQHLQESKSQIDELLFYLAEIENATDSSDELVTKELTQILHHLRRACDFLPPSKK